MSSSTNRSAPREVFADPLTGADVQHLAGLPAGRDDRVIPTLVGVPVAGALLVIPIDLADERIDVHDKPILARTGARRPCPTQAVGEYPVKLANMPERERPQKRP